MNDFSPTPRHDSFYLRQLALQGVAIFLTVSVAWPYCALRQTSLPWPEASLVIGALAFILASLTSQRWWWRLIHSLFIPAVALLSALNIAPGWYLAAFILTFLIYRGALTNRVPLHLSTRQTSLAVAEILSERTELKIVDLGAGIGSIACSLAKRRPDFQITGIENSIFPWMIGRLRSARLPNCRWLLGSFWDSPLTDYNVAYAYLSPAPMPSLWLKVTQEMRPGALFISNSFEVPDVEPTTVITLDDRRKTQLYCYRL